MSVAEIGKAATKGAIDIFIGKIISRVIGVIGGIILVRMLGPENYGSLIIAISAPNIILLFNDFGMDTAVTKFISEAHARNEASNVKYVLYSGLIFKAMLSGILTITCFLGSEIFASTLLGKSYVAPLIQIASILVFAWTFDNFSKSVLIGLDLTRYYGFFMIIAEGLLSIIPILLLILIGGVSSALFGMVSATLITSCLQLIACFFIISRLSKASDSQDGSLKEGVKLALKKTLAFGAPLQIIIMLNFGLGQFYNFMVVRYGTPFEVGNYGIAQSSNSFVDYMAWPISLVVFPMFSKIDFKQFSSAPSKMFKYSVKYSSLVILPAAIWILLFGKPLITILFGTEYAYAWNYLVLLSLGWLSYGLATVQLRKLLLSQGDTKFVTLLDLITAIAGVSLVLILVPVYGIVGLIISSLLAQWPAYVLMYKKVKGTYHVELPKKDLARVYLSVVITAILSLPLALSEINVLGKLIGGLMLLSLIYIFSTVLTSAVTIDDIANLRETKTVSFIDRILGKILDFMEKLINALKIQ